MVISHNLRSINANNRLASNVKAGSKSTEKLASGLKINRAGDNAAGLAISEKMRSQTRGLKQATANANDAISLIQTAEGGLNETHAILQRMRELAVQSANGTYQDDTDREALQSEIANLKEEVDRISSSTEYNKIKLLDGSLSGGSSGTTSFGSLYGSREQVAALGSAWVSVSSNVVGATLSFTTGATTNGENATIDLDGKTITLNLNANKTYTDSEINDLIQSALNPKNQTHSEMSITFKSDGGAVTMSATDGTTSGTVAGVRQTVAADLTTLVVGTSGAVGYSTNIKLTANTYGSVTNTVGTFGSITISTTAAAGAESVIVATAYNVGTAASITLNLSTGVEYTNKDIEGILSKAGFDYTVELTDGDQGNNSNANAAAGVIKFSVKNAAGVAGDVEDDGVGVGKANAAGGQGLTFQIGANGTADQRTSLVIRDMSSGGLGIASLNVGNQKDANSGIALVDGAIKAVSLQRADLGAKQNRLEYTINNLTTTNENLTAAESQIRDTNMAEEMIEFTRANILQQASQAMLAQANQAPQAVLQLLG